MRSIVIARICEESGRIFKAPSGGDHIPVARYRVAKRDVSEDERSIEIDRALCSAL
jgi:hypothetical protein